MPFWPKSLTSNAVTATHLTLIPASPWVLRWAHLIRSGGSALDVACGRGRHSHWLATQGFAVTALDRDADALAAVRAQWPTAATPPSQLLQADLEAQAWPLPDQTFDAVIVTNYLWRPLWPALLAALAPGGVYIHETFAHGNASVGKPSRADFLLQPGELLHACRGLNVVAYENGFCTGPDRYIQRIVAVREQPHDPHMPPRHALHAPASSSEGCAAGPSAG